MQFRKIGNSGINASVVALGTWTIGGGSFWYEVGEQESVKIIHAALDAGVNLIDTAPLYGFGRAEETVGKALKDRRGKAIISTKGGLWWKDGRGAPFFQIDGKKVNKCLRPETLREELEVSLKRLGTDYIDVYHTHWQAEAPDKTPIAETMGFLMKCKQEGKIRSIAVSNASPEQMDEYLAQGPIDANQPHYSMLARDIEKDLIPYCIERNIAILSYSTLENGILSGKIGMNTKLGDKEYRSGVSWYKPDNRGRVLDMLAQWNDLTEKYNCTTAQLVIAWTFHQPGITHCLCGARHAGQAEQNAAAGGLTLAEADILRMTDDIDALGQPL